MEIVEQASSLAASTVWGEPLNHEAYLMYWNREHLDSLMGMRSYGHKKVRLEYAIQFSVDSV